MGILTLLAEGGLTTINWGTALANVDFQPLIDGFISIIGVAVPILVPILVIRKGFDFLRGVLYSA